VTIDIPLDRRVVAPLCGAAGLAVLYLLVKTRKWWGGPVSRVWRSKRTWAGVAVLYTLGYATAAAFVPDLYESRLEAYPRSKDPKFQAASDIVMVALVPNIVLACAVCFLYFWWSEES
jgi:hypothetical protein